MNIYTQRVLSPTDIDTCFDIRHQVFVEEQQVPLDEDLDGKDKDSEHYLLYVDDLACGAARVRYVDDYAKIERVAILKAHRGQNLGMHLMQGILADLIKNTTYEKAKLSSQTYAIPFYEKLGFVVHGEEYLDANIPHRDMSLMLKTAVSARPESGKHVG